jgi:hypothetical protein
MEKIDFKKTLKDLYHATKTIKELVVDKGTFLSVDGKGQPGGPDFRIAFQQIFSIAYTVKFTLKMAGELDFAVPPPGCLYLDDPSKVPMSEWRWRLLIRIPDEVTTAHIREAGKAVKERRGLDTSRVKRITWKEGRCLQALHVGPYEAVGPTYERLFARADELGLASTGPCHEIYLSDPRRVAPEKLKTIVRIQFKKAR